MQWGKVTGPYCRFRSDGTFVLPSCGNIHGKWWMTGPETFSLYFLKHPSAPKGPGGTVPFTRQGDGSWHMPYGSLRNREALPQVAQEIEGTWTPTRHSKWRGCPVGPYVRANFYRYVVAADGFHGLGAAQD